MNPVPLLVMSISGLDVLSILFLSMMYINLHLIKYKSIQLNNQTPTKQNISWVDLPNAVRTVKTAVAAVMKDSNHHVEKIL